MAVSRAKTMAKANRISQLTMNEASPEKAGVGGSIPSLATNTLILNELSIAHQPELAVVTPVRIPVETRKPP
jgi:hypothetical protein